MRKNAHSDTKTSILCSKGLKTRVLKGKSAQKWRFCARGWLPRAQQRPLELSTARHKPCGVHLAAVRQATDCRNLPRNLPSCMPPPGTAPCMLPGTAPVRPTAVCYRRHACRRGTCCQDLPAAHTTVHTAVALPPRRYRKKLPSCATAEELPPCIPPGILPRDGSRAQRAGDSDVGANDKGAGDDPGDWVDAH